MKERNQCNYCVAQDCHQITLPDKSHAFSYYLRDVHASLVLTKHRMCKVLFRATGRRISKSSRSVARSREEGWAMRRRNATRRSGQQPQWSWKLGGPYHNKVLATHRKRRIDNC